MKNKIKDDLNFYEPSPHIMTHKIGFNMVKLRACIRLNEDILKKKNKDDKPATVDCIHHMKTLVDKEKNKKRGGH